jgi:hypothetical protein
MPLLEEANEFIGERGLGGALNFARQDRPADVNFEAFAANHPETRNDVLAAVFGVALAAVGAGAAVRALRAGATTAAAAVPVSPDVPVGTWRYRFTVHFFPLDPNSGLRSAWRSDVYDSTHELTQDELNSIESRLTGLFRSRYGFDGRRYGQDFIIESIVRGNQQ